MKKLFLLLLAVLSVSLCVSAQTRTVTGTVIEAATGDPILGASVTPAGSTKGVSTDLNGKFTLQIPASVKEITVSYVGMQAVTVPVTAGPMNIALKDAANVLDQMVVVGYTQKKLGTVAGSVAVVGESTFANVTTPSFVDAMQGQVAGLNIYQQSGDPSAAANSIAIRGTNSLNLSNTPLFILDGAPVSAAVFNSLNPSDIANITVLKDAASVAIYGSRATNGVIIIETKKGKYESESVTTFSASYGWSQAVQDNVDMMNATEYIKFQEIIGNPVPAEAYKLAYDYGVSTDWVKDQFSSAAPTYNVEASVRGGSSKSTYYASLSYMDQEGIIASSGMDRTNFRSSLDVKATDWLKLGFSTNIAYMKYVQNSASNASDVYLNNPMVFARMARPYDSANNWYLNADGSIRLTDEKAKRLLWTGLWTPQTYLDYNLPKRDRLTATLNLEQVLTPVKGLTIRARQAYDGYETRLRQTVYPHDKDIQTPWGPYQLGTPNDQGIVTGLANRSMTRYSSFTYTETAEYRGSIDGKHNYNVLVGFENILSRADGFDVSSSGHTDGRQMNLNDGPEITKNDVSSSFESDAMNSFFALAGYEYDGKYSADINFRRDGSSVFAPEHHWSNFWSAGATWNVKGESFLADVREIDDLRLRFSYGENGNSSLPSYLWMGLVGSYGTPYNGIVGIGISQAPNHDLRWEVTKGLDLGFTGRFYDRLTAEVDFYHKRTVDMILEIPYSYTTGVSGALGNIGDMTNTGVDVNLRGDVYKSKDWYVGVRANFNYNNNKLVKLFDGQDEYVLANKGLKYQVGENATQFYTVRYAGVNPENGNPQWYDKDGNITEVYNEDADAVLTGKSYIAPLTGGWGIEMRWKGLSVTTNFTWAAKKYMINNDRYFIENPASDFAANYNQTTDMFNIWTHPGQITDIPKYGSTIQFDDHLLENASFMRMKNLTVLYAFPKSLTDKWGLKGLNVHFTGRNLLTFSGYKGFDPEPQINVAAFRYPNTRQYELGFEVSF